MRAQSSLQSKLEQDAGHDAPSRPASASILPLPWCTHVVLSLDRLLDLDLGALGIGIGLGLGTATTGRAGEGGGEEVTGAKLGLGGGSITGRTGLGTRTGGLGTCKICVSQHF